MDRAAMEETFKNMYQIGYEAALKEGAVEPVCLGKRA